jgi:DNA-binding protein HU-beta
MPEIPLGRTPINVIWSISLNSESHPMATRPIAAKKAPAKKVAAPKPTAAAPKKNAAPAVVVTLKAVFEQLGETHDLPKKQVHAMMSELVAAVTAHLKKGAKLRMSGLGTLEVRKRAARMGRNPATGEAIRINASKKIAFRPAKELKEAM